MQLPKIKSTIHTFTLFDGRKLNFRPFKVGDEQILLEAKESKDPEIIVNTVLDVLQSLVVSNIDIKKLPHFDVENFLLNVRIASIGNILKVGMTCEECEEINEVDVDLSQVKFDGNKDDFKIKIGETDNSTPVYLIMKYPTFETFNAIKDKKEQNILRMCIDSIVDGDNEISLNDVSDEELDAWILDLDRDSTKSIYTFVENMPKLKSSIHFECKKCKHENKFEWSDFESFFT